MSVDSKMTAIAEAIRAKTGESGSLSLDAMAQAIASIPSGGGGITDYDVGFTYPAAGHRLHIPYDTTKRVAFIVCFSKAAWQAGSWSCGGVAVADGKNLSTGIDYFSFSWTLGRSQDGKLTSAGLVNWSAEQQAGCITLDRLSTAYNWDTGKRVDYFVAYDSDSTLHWRDDT